MRRYWKAGDVWDHYFATMGRGTAFILNMPPDITGQIPTYFTKETDAFGASLRATMASDLGGVTNVVCSGTHMWARAHLPAAMQGLYAEGQRHSDCWNAPCLVDAMAYYALTAAMPLALSMPWPTMP